MEKIKRRTIHFTAPRQKRTVLTTLLGAVVLGLLVITLCLMLIFIFS